MHDIVFKDLTFAASDATAPDGTKGPTEAWQHQAAVGYDGLVTAEGVRRLSWEDCTVRNTGNYAFRFNDGCRCAASLVGELHGAQHGQLRVPLQ